MSASSRSLRRKAAVAAFMVLGPVAASAAFTGSAADSDPTANLITSTIALAGTPHELRVEETRPGAETITLTARLAADGGRINRPIGWTLRRNGAVVFTVDAAGADIAIEPGHYEVEATYGTVTIRQPVELAPQRAVDLTLVMNVGGMRALAKLAGEPLPETIKADYTVYPADGSGNGAPLAETSTGGDILRLGAGQYRVESTLKPGNVTASTEITVKAGILSSLEIDHQASLVRLDLPSGTQWTLLSAATGWNATGTGPVSAMALAAGHYRLQQNGHAIEFDVKPGDRRTITPDATN